MKYTHKAKGGHLARLICDDALHSGVKKSVFLVKAVDSENEYLDYTDMKGNSLTFNRQYVERSQWDDVAVDTPIWVYRCGWKVQRRHFAGVSSSGVVQYFASGTTSHTHIHAVAASDSIAAVAAGTFVSLTPVAEEDLPWNKSIPL